MCLETPQPWYVCKCNHADTCDYNPDACECTEQARRAIIKAQKQFKSLDIDVGDEVPSPTLYIPQKKKSTHLTLTWYTRGIECVLYRARAHVLRLVGEGGRKALWYDDVTPCMMMWHYLRLVMMMWHYLRLIYIGEGRRKARLRIGGRDQGARCRSKRTVLCVEGLGFWN
jgi:hypothetical protein